MRTYSQRKKELAKESRETLEASVLNKEYNSFIRQFCDDELKEYHDRDKGIPYLGWFWRDVDFYHKIIPVGFASFTGFMENNKWDYPERDLEPEEADKIIDLIDRAMHERSKGGQVSETHKRVAKVLDELFDYMQTLRKPTADEWEYE